jgi:hypothetical protein
MDTCPGKNQTPSTTRRTRNPSTSLSYPHHERSTHSTSPDKRLSKSKLSFRKPGTQHARLEESPQLRVTVRWKPDTYSTISEDEDQWNYAATDTIHYILETVSDAVLFPWKNGSTTPHIPSLELNPDNLRNYIAPKITKIESIQMYVFSFRLCISTGAGKWISDKQTQKNMQQQKVEVNISNSSSDSGETISIAGYLFFKHPK